MHAVSTVQSNSTAAVGCRISQLKWCRRLPQLLLPQYIVGLAVMTTGYTTAILSTLTLYSKVLGPYPQVLLLLSPGEHIYASITLFFSL